MKRFNDLLLKIFLLVLVLSITSISAAKDEVARFPLGGSSLLSPNKQYLLENVNYDVSSEDQDSHALFLKNLKTGVQEKIYSYPRGVDAVWSAQGNILAVTDDAGSDNADCILFFPGDKTSKISIYNELTRIMPTNKTIFKQANDPDHFNHHVYITCNKWLSNDLLLIRIYGYGDIDPDGFTLWYKYKIGGNFELVKKEQGYE